MSDALLVVYSSPYFNVFVISDKAGGQGSVYSNNTTDYAALDLMYKNNKFGLGLGIKNFSISAWGSVGLVDTNDAKELDLTAAYTIGGLNLGITDYWFNSPEERYFLYDAHKTSHVFEANIGYDFGPVAIQWFTNFAGNDGVNKDGDRAYSSYAELSVPFTLGSVDWSAAVGAVPYATTSYGTDGFAVTNVSLKATKDIKVTDSFSIPIFGQIAANPRTQKAYLVFGLTLQP